MMHYVIVDIETTGGGPKTSKITEIAMYKFDGAQIIDEYQTLINPESKIPPFVVNLTGISDRMVQDSPRFFEIAKDIVEFTEDCIFVAHNVGFDYGIIRSEFRNLGYDFRRPHLCTVRASRYVLPGMDSYSLGKLANQLGIEISGRHRAGGDAYATVQLFTILLEKDPNGLSTFIQKEINPQVLHPKLDLDALDEIPDKTGIYKLFDECNRLIYIGKSIHIRQRVNQHLRNTTSKKALQMASEIARIEFELTGSELIALLRESEYIKTNRPLFNRSLTRSSFPYGLFYFSDANGYIQLSINHLNKTDLTPLCTFTTKKEAQSYLERISEEYRLCQKLCNLYKSSSACFNYGIQACDGACVGDESPAVYNKRVQHLIDLLTFNNQTFFVVDKGRERNEFSLIYIESGILAGIGYAPYYIRSKPIQSWKRFLDIIQDDRDARNILNLFLRKNKTHEVIRILKD